MAEQRDTARKIQDDLDVIQHCMTAIAIMSYRLPDEQGDRLGDRGLDAILFLSNLASEKIEKASDLVFALDLSDRRRRHG